MANNTPKHVELRDDGIEMDLNLSHFHRHDFNPHGQFSPWRLAQIFETARALAHHVQSYITGGLMNLGYTFFTIVLEYDIKPALYELDGRKPFERGMFEPACLHHKLLGFKRTSGTFKTTLYLKRSGVELANLRFKYVLIDAKTRRPAQLPDSYRQKLESKIANTRSPAAALTYKVRAPSSNAYKCEFTVQSSDTDLNRHTNNTTYIRLCWDTAAQAFLDNRVPWMKGGLENYRVMGMNMYYAKECKEGDKLTVYMWSNNENPQLLHFVFRKGNEDIYHCSMEFRRKSALLQAKL